MTKIQLRRDTAANWSTNNPTPSAGEPCFETDTGKLKIGDGITAYNSLPYQGGTSDTAVTTDTDQTISGKKTFTNDIVISQWNNKVSPIRETHIDLSNDNGNQFISANGTDKAFGMYTKDPNGIQLGTDGLDYTKGLSIKPSSLTFKSSDGTVTDLLTGGSGTGDVTAAGNNIFTGSNIFMGESLSVGNANGYSDIAKLSSEEYVIGDQENSTIVKPLEIGATFRSTVLKRDVMVLETDKTSATKKAYSIMTKSATNNKYMGHMAMPSDKYIDLELGASGTTYTAPADGWVVFGRKTTAGGQEIGIFKTLNTNQATRTISFTSDENLFVFLPITKGSDYTVTYSARGTLDRFKFVYTVGSEPSI